jgi:saccharopine dehydrogenase (NAD+, L-lysine-forming)
VQRLIKRRIQAAPPGPTDEERQRGRSLLWAEAEDAAGRKAVARLRGPDPYTLTVRAALAAVERVLAGAAPTGFRTPSTAYGPDFVLGLEGVVREDEA